MGCRTTFSMLLAALLSVTSLVNAEPRQHMNPVIQLLDQHKPVFGFFAPSNRRHGVPEGTVPDLVTHKPPEQLVAEATSNKSSDFIFDGSMEFNYDVMFPDFSAFMTALRKVGSVRKEPFLHLAYPIMAKIPLIAPDQEEARKRISQQLNLGTSGVMFVGVESAGEASEGIRAMRFKSHGGTRPDSVGEAPALWGMSEQEYRRKADVWPLNPEGELINWTIVESKEGLKHVREIAAVKGIGVLWPGAGTLREVFSSPGADGKPVLDQAAWESAIQQVLAACKEFQVPCGFPAGPNDIELRMKQGFSVFVSQWSDAGFQAVKIGRTAAGRSPSDQ